MRKVLKFPWNSKNSHSQNSPSGSQSNTLRIQSPDHNVYEIEMASEDGIGRDVTSTAAGVAAAGLENSLQLRTVFSRFPSLKRRRRKRRKNWHKLGENVFEMRLHSNGREVIPRLFRTRRVASLARSASREITKFNLPGHSSIFFPDCHHGSSSSSFSFQTGQTGRKRSAAATNHPGAFVRIRNMTPCSVFRRHLDFVNVVIGGLDP